MLLDKGYIEFEIFRYKHFFCKTKIRRKSDEESENFSIYLLRSTTMRNFYNNTPFSYHFHISNTGLIRIDICHDD